MARSAKVNQYLVIWFVTFGSLTYGYCSSIIATTLAQPSFITYMHLDTDSNAAQLFGAINGLFQAGGYIGTLTTSLTADYFGRRVALLIGALFSLVGGALQAGSVNIAMYLVMRFITGLGVGMLIVMVPLYQTEIAPPEIRGFIVSTHAISLSCGYVLASWVGLGFYFVNANGAQWRLPLAIQCFPPLFLAIGCMWLPESPRWLISKDRADDAFKSFKSTRAESASTDLNDTVAVQAEFDLIVAQINHEKQNQVSIMQLLRRPSMRARFLIGFITLFGYQCTGTQVINNYGPELYKGLGFSTVSQLLIQCGWISTCPFGNIISMFLIDRLGRTKMFLIGYVLVIMALIGECATVSVYNRTGNLGAASGAVYFLFMHVVSTTVFADGTTYIYASEIFPTPQRAKGAAFSLSGQYAATIIFLSSAPVAFGKIGWKYYLVFLVLTTLLWFIILFTFPETKNKSLEELSAVFGDSVEGLTSKQEDDLYRARGHHKDHHPDAIVDDDYKVPASHLEEAVEKH